MPFGGFREVFGLVFFDGSAGRNLYVVVARKGTESDAESAWGIVTGALTVLFGSCDSRKGLAPFNLVFAIELLGEVADMCASFVDVLDADPTACETVEFEGDGLVEEGRAFAGFSIFVGV